MSYHEESLNGGRVKGERGGSCLGRCWGCVEAFRLEQRLREAGSDIHKTDAEEADGQAYLWLRLRWMGRHICGWGLKVIKLRRLSPLGGHGLSIKIWRSIYGRSLSSSTQEQSKEISHQASISGGIRYHETPSLFEKMLWGGFGGLSFFVLTVCCNSSTFPHSSLQAVNETPVQRLRNSFLELELNTCTHQEKK